ncbi:MULTISPECIES: helix-hairpin-helix domain-containing protein [Leptospira]|uniref:Pathogenicity locus n=1 Tax=Leptospira santarosai serovar Shermani str. LT 821 TaxID=758847 RepID=K8Y6R8_9LEPT|nr:MULTISPECIES: helix-hairpin-helix domain-containing protein [Leptospira]AVV79725.1 Pathogenicity locus [Leptospira santarosai]EKO78229.1 pathogenicity locus [Leptospira sp. Fiocruz LV3954]EKS07568.1 pathogenicity locus [Leptospira santarosai str. JET]EKT88636.1 pathogenicity locus [Leptospira santarosai serovar Shermani str. LT 821]EMI62529.1 pathogenicity locus [Leptospira sp. Fiocruz LV4135]
MSKKEYSKSSGEYPEQFDILKKFKTLPGVGKSIAMDYWNLGFRNLDEIRSADPEKLYVRCCELHGGHVDRCMLYVFRCVHYSLNAKKPNPEKLKWWNWKDSEKIQKSKR